MPCQCDALCDLLDTMQAARQAGRADAGTLPRWLQEGFTSSLQLLTRGLLLSIRAC
jgi:hypothetical protein